MHRGRALVVSSPGPQEPDDRDLAAAAKYFARAKSTSTQRIYTRAWAEFAEYCHWRRRPPTPATAKAVVGFLSYLADAGASASSIRQKLSAIAWVHRIKKLPEPSRFVEVITFMEGVSRTRALTQAKRDPKTVLDRALLSRIVNAIDTPYPANLRDRALLLLDYFGLLRRSEVVSLRIEDVDYSDDGSMLILLRQSKTDQRAEGFTLPYPRLDDGFAEICPVRALKAWLDVLRDEHSLTHGWIFRGISRWGKLDTHDRHLTDQVVNTLVKRLAEKIGIPPAEISAHAALRAGMATQLDRDNVPFGVIKRAGRWKSDAVARGYIRRTDADVLAALRAAGQG